MKRPASLVYAPDEVPPLHVTAFNAIQHVGLIAINLVYPLLVFRLVDAPLPLSSTLLAVGMIVLGAGTLLQVLRLGPVGSGFLCPATFSAAYLSPSLLAAKAGGLPWLFGMTLLAMPPQVCAVRRTFGLAVTCRMLFVVATSRANCGLADHSKATTPTTCGPAIEVPLRLP